VLPSPEPHSGEVTPPFRLTPDASTGALARKGLPSYYRADLAIAERLADPTNGQCSGT